MKTIGLLGGMSWESTMSYYQGLNQGVKAALGGLNSAKICLYSINFDEIEKHQRLGQWDEAAKILSKAAQNIEAGGADFLLICTNPVHKKPCIKWHLKLKVINQLQRSYPIN